FRRQILRRPAAHRPKGGAKGPRGCGCGGVFTAFECSRPGLNPNGSPTAWVPFWKGGTAEWVRDGDGSERKIAAASDMQLAAARVRLFLRFQEGLHLGHMGDGGGGARMGDGQGRGGGG